MLCKDANAPKMNTENFEEILFSDFPGLKLCVFIQTLFYLL
jgi:hypothetical protein